MSDDEVSLGIDGRAVSTPPTASVIQAFSASGGALVTNIGCMGQGVCGLCRCMVRREGSREMSMGFGCETPVQAGMQVCVRLLFPAEAAARLTISLRPRLPARPRRAEGHRMRGGGRRSGGEGGVFRVHHVQPLHPGLSRADPAHHFGLFIRRALAAFTLRPVELMRRLRQIESGALTVVESSLSTFRNEYVSSTRRRS